MEGLPAETPAETFAIVGASTEYALLQISGPGQLRASLNGPRLQKSGQLGSSAILNRAAPDLDLDGSAGQLHRRASASRVVSTRFSAHRFRISAVSNSAGKRTSTCPAGRVPAVGDFP